MIRRPPRTIPFVLLMTGPPLSLKTQTALRLSQFLRATLVESSYLGVYPGPSECRKLGAAGTKLRRSTVRARRHENMLTMARACVETGEPFILDSAYSSVESRRKVYALIADHTRYRMVVVYCHCQDDLVLEQRLEYRKRDLFSPEPDLVDKKYLDAVRREYDRPIGGKPERFRGKPVEVVAFDTASRVAKVVLEKGRPSALATTIAGFLNYEAAVGEL